MVRAIWNEIRGPVHPKGSRNVPALEDCVPELPASLESLLNQGYGLEDIGDMFGVSSGSALNWLRKFGLHSSYRQTRSRVFSDIHNRFIPVSGVMGTRLGIRDPDQSKSRPVTAAQRERMRKLGSATRGRTLEVCLRGHEFAKAGRIKGSYQCKICRRLYQKKVLSTPEGRERRRLTSLKFYQANKDQLNAEQRRLRATSAEHRERAHTASAKYYAKMKDPQNARQWQDRLLKSRLRARSPERRERVRIANAEYYAKNRDRLNARRRELRTIKKVQQ